MIKENDSIAIGVSGGKDSLMLLLALSSIQNYYPLKFTITAITIDPLFNGTQTDYSSLSTLCSTLKIKHIIKRHPIWEIVFNIRNEKSPCSLCSRMRRGILHNICIKEKCNTIALGHHLDDAVQTFFMNLFQGGRIACFSPVSYLSRKKLLMIRPMIFCTEEEIIGNLKGLNPPICRSECPIDGKTEREKTKNLIKNLEKKYPCLQYKVINSLRDLHISNW